MYTATRKYAITGAFLLAVREYLINGKLIDIHISYEILIVYLKSRQCYITLKCLIMSIKR